MVSATGLNGRSRKLDSWVEFESAGRLLEHPAAASAPVQEGTKA